MFIQKKYQSFIADMDKFEFIVLFNLGKNCIDSPCSYAWSNS